MNCQVRGWERWIGDEPGVRGPPAERGDDRLVPFEH